MPDPARRDDSPFTIRVVDDLDGMDALERAWNALAPPDGKPMRQFAWMRSVAGAFCEPGDLRVYVCERAGRVEAIAPLVQRAAPARLEVLGLKETGEPPDVPIGTPEGIEHLARALAGAGIPFVHERLPAHSPVFGALRGAFAGRGWLRVVATDPTPAIDLDASWADPQKHFNSGRRSDLRRMGRRADQEGQVSFEVVVPETPADLERLLDEAWTVEAAGWKGERGSALAANPRLGGFYRAYAHRAWRHGILRLAFMRIDGRAVAMQLVAECDRRWWLLKIGYDERHARCAPGSLLLVHTIAHAARRGLVAYEFLGNPDAWSMQWARTVRHSVAIKAYPFSLKALGALRSDAVRAIKTRLGRMKSVGAAVPGLQEAVEIAEVLRFVPTKGAGSEPVSLGRHGPVETSYPIRPPRGLHPHRGGGGDADIRRRDRDGVGDHPRHRGRAEALAQRDARRRHRDRAHPVRPAAEAVAVPRGRHGCFQRQRCGDRDDCGWGLLRQSAEWRRPLARPRTHRDRCY